MIPKSTSEVRILLLSYYIYPRLEIGIHPSCSAHKKPTAVIGVVTNEKIPRPMDVHKDGFILIKRSKNFIVEEGRPLFLISIYTVTCNVTSSSTHASIPSKAFTERSWQPHRDICYARLPASTQYWKAVTRACTQQHAQRHCLLRGWTDEKHFQ